LDYLLTFNIDEEAALGY